MGRPPLPFAMERIELRLPTDLVAEIDRWRVSRPGLLGKQDAIREMLIRFLEAERQSGALPPAPAKRRKPKP
jgi:metal-responsive CopG/Arc/MetJ family transcriptional regulator